MGPEKAEKGSEKGSDPFVDPIVVAMGFDPMSEETDEMLMLAYGKGDARAFEVLYGRYRAPLYRYFLRQLKEPASANDLYQGCWEKVIKARSRYRQTSPFRAWLFRIAHNHLMDHFRAQRPGTELPDELEDPLQQDSGEQLDEAKKQQQLRQALTRLPAEQRDVLLLRLEGGLNLAQISEVTGAAAETVKSRLRYATAKLQQALKP